LSYSLSNIEIDMAEVDVPGLSVGGRINGDDYKGPQPLYLSQGLYSGKVNYFPGRWS
jgi:hypothetical protein